ncbi:MAG: hypothetical protein IPI32_06945 [Austwickia sp.]|nr:hypothetical protein [Austwickia sp.]
MQNITRLAIIDRGEPAVRVVAAVGNLNRSRTVPTGSATDAAPTDPSSSASSPAPITTVVVHTGPKTRAWYAREADETVQLPGEPGTLLPAQVVIDALVAAAVDAVWLGRVPCADLAELVAACEGVGLTLVGPNSTTVRALTDRSALRSLVDEAGAALLDTRQDARGLRRLEADFIVDVPGNVWSLGLRDVSVRRGDHLLIAELPAPGVDALAAEAMQHIVEELAQATGYRGAGTVQFALDPDTGGFWVRSVDPYPRPDQALYEESTGTSVIGMRIQVARGDRPPEPPRPEGHAIAVRVRAQDPDADFAPATTTVEMVSLPVGTGVRIDASLREGDVINAAIDPTVASLTGWGHDRTEAIARVRRGLERMVIVLQDGVTTRSNVLVLLNHPELTAGAVPEHWADDLIAAGDNRPRRDPVALLAAAVEAYDADLAMVRTAFFATAERGRPQEPEAVGSRMLLSYAGQEYRVRVDRTGATTYRIGVGGDVIDIGVEKLNPFERRIVVGGHTHRVVAAAQGALFRVEIDGLLHTVTRQDGVVVRSGSPALVSAVLVSPGQWVTKGDPVAVLESMKMVSTVAAPFDGQVTSVAVLPNAQIERGAPLMRIRAAGADVDAYGEAPDLGADALISQDRLDLGQLAAGGVETGLDVQGIYAQLRNYLLGYDLDPQTVKSLNAQQKQISFGSAPADPVLLACEDELLDVYSDVGSLYRPRTEADDADGDELATVANSQEYFISYLQWLDPDRAHLPQRYRQRLERALARYGVAGLAHTAELEHAVVWMFRSFSRVPALAGVIRAILERRLANAEELSGRDQGEQRARIERLAAATQGRQQAIADFSRDLIFHFYDEPLMDAVVRDVLDEMEQHLSALRLQPDRQDRDERVARLVWSPHPMRGTLLRAWREAVDTGAEASFGAAILQAHTQRFYRIRELRALSAVEYHGTQLMTADYDHEGRGFHLIVAYAPLEEVPHVSDAVAAHLATLGEDAAEREVILDVTTWRAGEQPDIEDTVHEVDDLLRQSDFGRSLHRFDITVTSLEGPGAEKDRTQHLSYRQDVEEGHPGYSEELQYRNLHPMLAKRLDLWRLANFDLERLASPEDVYLFHGRAHDNPKDHRLFALAEVRDLTKVSNEATGEVSYPRLGRIGLEALAAMRAALAQFPPRERPAANRLVLSVRPVWDVPREDWAALARTYEPLARGAGLEKLVLHVKVRDVDESGRSVLLDRVLYLEGIGRGGTTIRLGEPGPNPVRPLTRYAQKVLTAQRFGSPYPYEIVRMLTPEEDSASRFPTGSFREMDLDEAGELVFVDREPAGNTAHIVIGLLTNYTDVYPEGMTRVAMLSDPTQGLGNLAEPECRRINACLEYALAHELPVEWYAVSSGALIAMDSGSENMDWIALTLRRLIEFTQAGGEINVIVTGINVGGQPYWNAEATMLMHTKGVLIMTPSSAMVLTGKQALDFSGAVSAEDNFGIGGYDHVMGLNGQGQYWAASFEDACAMLLHHYDFTYVVPGERFPRRQPTVDVPDRDVQESPHAALPGSSFRTVADVFSKETNPDRKQPFDMRSVMRAVSDIDAQPLERWQHLRDGENSIVWDTTVGGIPVCMIGLESHQTPRQGFVPADGPPVWSSGTLYPQASRKTARAINAATYNRPLVVLANLSGFDGSPESMRRRQLEYGAEIGRAITNFRGPIVFVVVSRYHGGAFVVFSKQLNESMEIAAVEGAFCSVIGGAPAAATVFAREVKVRTDRDERVVAARAALGTATGAEAGPLRARLAEVTEAVRSEKLGQVADEFDAIHTIERAQRVGSVDEIIAASDVRPWIIEALERGMAREEAVWNAQG